MYLNPKGLWKGLRAIGMGESQRRIGGDVTIETRYYILSFARDVQRFATSIRSHWGIENCGLMACLTSLFGKMSRVFVPDMLIIIWRSCVTLRSIFLRPRKDRQDWDQSQASQGWLEQ